MATPKIRITGEQKLRADVDPHKVTAEDTGTLAFAEIYYINTATRGDVVPTHEVAVVDESGKNKIIEFTYEDDTVWIGDISTIDEIFPGTSAQVRSLENDEDGVIDIPTVLFVGESGKRGLFEKIALKIIKIFTKNAVQPLVKDLAAKLEDQQLNHKTGLFRLTKQFGLEPPKVENGGNYLLFLHGTISSAQGAFHELQGTTDASGLPISPPPPVWSFITQTYGENILAFQHKTLTQSPLENVLDLVKALPQTVTLTLVSHSRGGLIGDILNRFCLADPTKRGFSANEKNFLCTPGILSRVRRSN